MLHGNIVRFKNMLYIVPLILKKYSPSRYTRGYTTHCQYKYTLILIFLSYSFFPHSYTHILQTTMLAQLNHYTAHCI